jgi:hypothetical protein
MHRGIVRKSEWILLGMTALFLCGLLALHAHDRAKLRSQRVVTETEVPQEEILPDLSPMDLNTAMNEELAQLP